MEGKTMSGTVTTQSSPPEVKYHNDALALGGRPAPKELLLDLTSLEREYFERQPDGKYKVCAIKHRP